MKIKGVRHGITAALPSMHRQKSRAFHRHLVRGRPSGWARLRGLGADQSVPWALSEGLREETKPHNIDTTVISPGAVVIELPSSVTTRTPGRGFANATRRLRSRPSRLQAQLLSPSAGRRMWM